MSDYVKLEEKLKEDLNYALDEWEQNHNDANWEPEQTLAKICDVIEVAVNDFLRHNPDPMDDRHPSKIIPENVLGYLLKSITRIENFVNKLVITYVLAKDNLQRNITSARLILNLLPGLDSSLILMDSDNLISQLFRWAQQSESRELRAYSLALLGEAMGPEQAHVYRQSNGTLIPIALQNLRNFFLMEQTSASAHNTNSSSQKRRRISGQDDDHKNEPKRSKYSELYENKAPFLLQQKQKLTDHSSNHSLTDELPIDRMSRNTTSQIESVNRPTIPRLRTTDPMDQTITDESTGTLWKSQMQSLVVGDAYTLWPLSEDMEQRLILRYLIPTCEYVDHLSIVLENNALDVVLGYLSTLDKKDSSSGIGKYRHRNGNLSARLLFDVLKFTSSLLIHRKIAWEFVSAHGIEKLLCIDKYSIASTSVATCLYYVVYNVDIMEKICRDLPESILSAMTDYVLWLLDHSHESGRSSATLFCAYGMRFRHILDRFDQSDGLRRLFNYVSTLTILQDESEYNESFHDDHYVQSILTMKNAVLGFRMYLVSHIFMKIEQIKRFNNSHSISSVVPLPSTSSRPHTYSKGMLLDDETLKVYANYIVQSQCLMQSQHSNWLPVERFRMLGIIKFLLQILTNFPEWNLWDKSGKNELLKLVLDLLNLLSISPKIQLDFCDTITIKQVSPSYGIGIILEFADGNLVQDPSVQRLALEIMINCLCGPSQGKGLGVHYRLSDSFSRTLLPQEFDECSFNEETDCQNSGQIQQQSSDNRQVQVRAKLYLTPFDILRCLWKCSKLCDAIMTLTNLLYIQTPPTDADGLRELACHALNGLTRYEPVRQIISKLPIITANGLNTLMKTPILNEKRIEHHRFCEQARQLIECVSQTRLPQLPQLDLTQEKLWKASVVAQTRVQFNFKELLQSIYQQLIDIGLKKSAIQLQAEAQLPTLPASRIPSSPAHLPNFPRQNEYSFSSILRLPLYDESHRNSVLIDRQLHSPLPSSPSFEPKTPQLPTPISSNLRSPLFPGLTNRSSLRIPIRLTPLASPQNNTGATTIATATQISKSPRLFSMQQMQNIGQQAQSQPFALQIKPHKSLYEIVTEYFRNEHASCQNPVTQCPPFSLFYPHRCPEPKPLYSAPNNIVRRHLVRSNPPHRCTGELIRQSDRRMIFSRFRQMRTITDENETFTCCGFSHNDEQIMLGTYVGDIMVYNIRTGHHETTMNCHHSALTSISHSKNGSLMLTSSAYVRPYSILWRTDMNNQNQRYESLTEFNEDMFLSFGNLSSNQIIGTSGPRATIYDTETGQPVVQLFDEILANHYTRNRACFDPIDELILNDGILFDPRIFPKGRVLHKFDKLNPDISGIFHPRSSEIIINCEIWDMRTYRLLNTIPALNQSRIFFTSTGAIFFGIEYQQERDERFPQIFGSNFRSYDSSNYQVITTQETRRHLLDFCTDYGSDAYVAALETTVREDEDANLCRIYEVGRRREADEEEEEQEDQNPPDNDNDEDDNGSSSSQSSSTNTDDAHSSSEYDPFDRLLEERNPTVSTENNEIRSDNAMNENDQGQEDSHNSNTEEPSTSAGIVGLQSHHRPVCRQNAIFSAQHRRTSSTSPIELLFDSQENEDDDESYDESYTSEDSDQTEDTDDYEAYEDEDDLSEG